MTTWHRCSKRCKHKCATLGASERLPIKHPTTPSSGPLSSDDRESQRQAQDARRGSPSPDQNMSTDCSQHIWTTSLPRRSQCSPSPFPDECAQSHQQAAPGRRRHLRPSTSQPQTEWPLALSPGEDRQPLALASEEPASKKRRTWAGTGTHIASVLREWIEVWSRAQASEPWTTWTQRLEHWLVLDSFRGQASSGKVCLICSRIRKGDPTF